MSNNHVGFAAESAVDTELLEGLAKRLPRGESAYIQGVEAEAMLTGYSPEKLLSLAAVAVVLVAERQLQNDAEAGA